MNTRIHTKFGILMLLSMLVFPVATQAQEMSIDSADPSEAEQGTVNLDVVINGGGFDKTVKEVKFLVHCEQPCTDDSGGIVVNSFRVDNAKKITANLDVGAAAKLSGYDIAVRTRGRGGKGTTYRGENLFTVKLRPNQQLLSCGELIKEHKGTCTCQFVWNGDDAFLPALLEDCVTSETLRVRNRFRGSGEGPGNQSTITAVPCDPLNGQDCSVVAERTFEGSSVIASTSHRNSIRGLDIRFHDDVERGCGNGVEAGVSFILTEFTPDPRIPDPLLRNSFLNIREIGIFSEHQPLCNGIEIIRTDGYSDKYSNPSDPEVARDWKIYAHDNLIAAGSYEQAGIVMLGIMPSESINPPSVFGNTIGAAVCGQPDLPPPVGILFGDLTWDPVNQIDGVVESNVINMASACTDTGIEVVGDLSDEKDKQTTVKVNKNTIAGAYLGIDVYDGVEEVNLSGNNLSGDNWPVGVDSSAQCTQTKGKPNKISGYDVKISDAGCP